jgi:hypothetical protein
MLCIWFDSLSPSNELEMEWFLHLLNILEFLGVAVPSYISGLGTLDLIENNWLVDRVNQWSFFVVQHHKIVQQWAILQVFLIATMAIREANENKC